MKVFINGYLKFEIHFLSIYSKDARLPKIEQWKAFVQYNLADNSYNSNLLNYNIIIFHSAYQFLPTVKSSVLSSSAWVSASNG